MVAVLRRLIMCITCTILVQVSCGHQHMTDKFSTKGGLEDEQMLTVRMESMPSQGIPMGPAR